MSITLSQIAETIGADLSSVPKALRETVITGINSLSQAGAGEITFLSSASHLANLETTRAEAIVVQQEHADKAPVPVLVHPQPYIAYALMSELFIAGRKDQSVHPSAVVSDSAVIGSNVYIGENAVIGDNVSIENDVQIGANTSVGENAIIGSGTILHPNISVYANTQIGENCIIHSGTVLGSDGFGFAPSDNGWIKIHQLGAVHIGNDVEIGANCCVDRGAIDNTIISDGVKIDNQVQIGHNCHLGENTLIISQVGIAGSTKIGKNCIFAGQSGAAGHLNIADNVTISARGMITRSIDKPGTYASGTSFSEASVWRKNVVRFNQLNSLFKRLTIVEKKLEK